MAVNIVSVNGSEILNLTDATATAASILSGYTAYGADGTKITGTATGGGVDGDELAYGITVTGAIVGSAIVGSAVLTE